MQQKLTPIWVSPRGRKVRLRVLRRHGRVPPTETRKGSQCLLTQQVSITSVVPRQWCEPRNKHLHMLNPNSNILADSVIQRAICWDTTSRSKHPRLNTTVIHGTDFHNGSPWRIWSQGKLRDKHRRGNHASKPDGLHFLKNQVFLKHARNLTWNYSCPWTLKWGFLLNFKLGLKSNILFAEIVITTCQINTIG